MIKVLAHGEHNAICNNCGCVFRYEAEDIEDNSKELGAPRERTYITTRRYQPRFCEWIVCPDCGEKVYLS